jgi:hypothetical protein
MDAELLIEEGEKAFGVQLNRSELSGDITLGVLRDVSF